ncbi:glycosyltransferase family A protein [Mucilaginibacter puniceus]
MTVSVIITSYNYGHFLSEAIESVLGQSFDRNDVEIIVINDGSTDNTDNVVRKYNIKLISQPNMGLPTARNNGINISTGKFILPLDADDKLAPSFLEKTVPVIQNSPDIGVVYTHRSHFGLKNTIKLAKTFDIEELRKKNQLNYCSLFRKSAWIEVNGYNTNMVWGCEDWDFWLKVAQTHWRFELVDEVLFYYRKHTNSLIDIAAKNFDIVLNQIYNNHPRLYSNNIPVEHKNGISYFKSQED